MTPFWIEYSLYDECQRHIYPLLYENNARVVLTLHQRMHLCAAAGKASTRAKGPTSETHLARQTALTLAEKLDDKEIRLQAHYGLWLYCLRTGALVKRVNMRSQCANWRDPSMMQKPMPPGCVFSVSPCIFRSA